MSYKSKLDNYREKTENRANSLNEKEVRSTVKECDTNRKSTIKDLNELENIPFLGLGGLKAEDVFDITCNAFRKRLDSIEKCR